MPNVKLKDSSGTEVTYSGIQTITVPDADSENLITFTYIETELDNYRDMRNIIDSGIYSSTSCTYENYEVRSFAYDTLLGTWFLDHTAMRAIKLPASISTFTTITFFGDMFLMSNTLLGYYKPSTGEYVELENSVGYNWTSRIYTKYGYLLLPWNSTAPVAYYVDSSYEIHELSSPSLGSPNQDYVWPTSQGVLFFIYTSTNSHYPVYFNENTLTFVSPPQKSMKNVVAKSETEYFMYGGGGVYYFNENTSTFTLKVSLSENQSYVYTDNTVTASGAFITIVSRIYYIDFSTNSVSQLYYASNIRLYQVASGPNYIFYASNNITGSGIIRLNVSTSAIDTPYPIAYYWTYIYKHNSKTLLSTTSTSNTGIVSVDGTTGDVVQIFSSGYGWVDCVELKLGIAICATSRSYGILYYKFSTETITQVYSSGYNWIYRVGPLFTSKSSSDGLVLINELTATATMVKASTYRVDSFVDVGSGILAWSSSSSGLYYVDYATYTYHLVYSSILGHKYLLLGNDVILYKDTPSSTHLVYWSSNSPTTYTILKSSFYNIRLVQVLEEDEYVLFGSDSVSGLWLFQHSTMTMTAIYPSLTGWHSVIPVDNGWLIIAGDGNASGVVFLNKSFVGSSAYTYGIWSRHTDLGDGTILIEAKYFGHILRLLWNNTTNTISEL